MAFACLHVSFLMLVFQEYGIFKKKITSSSELLSNNSLFGGQLKRTSNSRARSASDLSSYN